MKLRKKYIMVKWGFIPGAQCWFRKPINVIYHIKQKIISVDAEKAFFEVGSTQCGVQGGA